MKKNKEGQVLCRNENCDTYFTMYNSLMPFCSYSCKTDHLKNKQPKNKRKSNFINPYSAKRSKENKIYTARRIVFLYKNKECVIKSDKCTKAATTIEHSAGRKGYYDDWARDNNISLYLDERFWKPACHNCNLELEKNSELSKKHQLSKIHGGKKI